MRGWKRKFASGAAIAAATVSVAWAGWENRVSAYDTRRIEKLDEARQKALSEARTGRDIQMIHALLDMQARPVTAAWLSGDWRCRTIKVGGMSPDVVYSWFHCRIVGRDGRLMFDKLSGTQRLSGSLYPHESGGFVLLAGLSVDREPRHSYSGSGAAAGAETTPDDAVGLLDATGPRTARIEFPYPMQESTLDIIEMRR